MKECADIVIIGAGIAGISAGARLSSHADVIVLEREPVPGMHATGRSAATYIRNYGNATLRALNAASHADLATPLPEFSEAGFLSPRGLLYLAKPEDSAALDDELDDAKGMQEITVEEATRHFPILRPGLFSRAAIEPDASDIDVDRLMQSFLRQMRAAGGRLVTEVEVLGLHRVGGNWQIETTTGSYVAPTVVNAAGAWADLIGLMAGARAKGLVPKRRSAALLPFADRDVTHWPLVASIAEDWYAKPDAGRLLVSPADQDPVAPMDAWPDEMVLAEGLHRFELATQVSVTRIEHKWAGLRTFAPDKTPVVGFDPDVQDFFWLAGQGGYGIQTAPALSQIAADLVMSGTTEVVEPTIVSNLSPAREAVR